MIHSKLINASEVVEPNVTQNKLPLGFYCYKCSYSVNFNDKYIVAYALNIPNMLFME